MYVRYVVITSFLPSPVEKVQLVKFGKMPIFMEHLNIMTLLAIKRMYCGGNHINVMCVVMPEVISFHFQGTQEHTLARCLD
jgi:hypothetical protein